MAFRLALSALLVAAVIGNTLAGPHYRLVRNADPAPAPAQQKASNVVVKSIYQNQQPQQVYQQAQQVYQQPQQVYQQAKSAIPAAPQPAAKSGNFAASQQAQIVQQSSDFNPADNSYSYSFQSDNGISQQAVGSYDNQGKYSVQGSYSYTGVDGYPVSISYVADENGYQAVGDAIPKPDQAIIKAVEYLRSLPPQKDEQQ